uniref:glycosyl hydrolase family 28-related protein n=1 Tax=Halegenticoccus soli TaxID=1985678 RepID=UPI000C6D2ACA
MSEERFDRGLGRRPYLKALGSALGSAVLAGCGGDPGRVGASDLPAARREDGRPGPAMEPVDGAIPYADRYDAVVDVAAAGADRTGEAAINGTLDSLVADDTLLYFPEGRYRIDGSWTIQGYRNVGMVGDGAVLEVPPGYAGAWIVVDAVSSFQFEGFVLDNTARRTAGLVQLLCDGGRNVVRNVVVAGRQDVTGTTTHAFVLRVSGADTHLSLESVDMSAGAADGTAVFVHPTDRPGSLTFRDCRIAGWGTQGLYASAHGGPIRVVGGEYANNGLAQIRVGGGNGGTRAIVKDVLVRVDDPRPGMANMRGIWLKEGDETLIENCEVRVADLGGTTSSGGIVVGREHGRTAIRDTTLRIDAPTYGIKLRRPKAGNFYAPSLARPPEKWSVSAENLRIVGRAPGTAAIELIGRPESTLRNVEIRQPGAGRDGVTVADSLGTTIKGLAASVGRYPLLVGVRSKQDECVVHLGKVESLSTTYDVKELRPFLPGASPPFCLDSNLLGDLNGSAAIAITGVTEAGLQGEVVLDGTEAERAQSEG